MDYLYESPIGCLLLSCDESSITGLHFADMQKGLIHGGKTEAPLPSVMKACITQLDEYFAGERKVFELPLNNDGTPFRKMVWSELEKIPYGETVTYRDIAERIGNLRAVRAVGGANHHNNISIIVPCHRVIGADGGLTGYGGEIWRKQWLLEHETKNRGAGDNHG